MLKIGIVLTTYNGFYLVNNKLPNRPKGDKEILIDFCKNKNVICSENTLLKIPKSILKVVKSISCDNINYDINLGIKTFSGKYIPDVLFNFLTDNVDDIDLSISSKLRLNEFNDICNSYYKKRILNSLSQYIKHKNLFKIYVKKGLKCL